MPKVDSSAIDFVDYVDATSALRVVFHNDDQTYEYPSVPRDLYDRMLGAESVGIFFNTHIRRQYSARVV